MKIGVINSGSSSLKYKLFELETMQVIEEKMIENIGESDAVVQNHEEALQKLNIDFDSLDAMGHRVVHGGEEFCEPTFFDEKKLERLRLLNHLAPLHNPANVLGMEVVMRSAPSLLQVGVFDTAFHTTMPPEAFLYALPKELYKQHHIRRYGFHGTSHSYLLDQVAKKLQKDKNQLNIITLHLGNGASACAIKRGKSIDTSMGFTPLEGLVMGSRSGDLDSAIVLYLQEHLEMSSQEIEVLLNKKSGLLGLCGTNDVREIVEKNDEDSKLAIDMMVRRIQKYIGSYMVLLEDVDAIVFSGGIGENSQEIRERVLDNKLIQNIPSFVIPTDEELQIALLVREKLLRK